MNMTVHVIISTYTLSCGSISILYQFDEHVDDCVISTCTHDTILFFSLTPLANTKSDQFDQPMIARMVIIREIIEIVVWMVVLDRYWNKTCSPSSFSIAGLSKAAGGPPSSAPSSTSSRVTRTSSLNTSKPTSREAKISTGTKESASKEPALKRRTGVTGSSRRTSEGRTPRTSRGEPSYFLWFL